MEFVLGIDLGTSSVKVVIVNKASRKLVAQAVENHDANVKLDNFKVASEQNISKIISALETCMTTLEQKFFDYLKQVVCIAVCGQMHGCMLWNSSILRTNATSAALLRKIALGQVQVSHLITWQDRRIIESFISNLPLADSHLHVHSGFGCLSLLWLKMYQPEVFQVYDTAGTLADFVVCCMCHTAKPKMTVQNAASWGYFDVQNLSWNTEILSAFGLPLSLLPATSRTCKEPIGSLNGLWHSIPSQIVVFPSYGDFQCSFYSSYQPNSAILNIGTSSQLSFRMPDNFLPPKIRNLTSESVVYFPYFEGDYLAVAASLNGGNVLSEFLNLLRNWRSELMPRTTMIDIPNSLALPGKSHKISELTEDEMWCKILSLVDTSTPPNQKLDIKATLFGERHKPLEGFSIRNLFSSTDLSLANIAENILESIIANLDEMMPRKMLKDNSITSLILCGQATKAHFKNVIERLYSSDMQILCEEDSQSCAALGCALFASNFYSNSGG